MCKSLINSIEEALIQLRYAVADYYSCSEIECAGVFGSLDAPLRELRECLSSTESAIDLLRGTPGAAETERREPVAGALTQLDEAAGLPERA